jgi:hypothetical protein
MALWDPGVSELEREERRERIVGCEKWDLPSLLECNQI